MNTHPYLRAYMAGIVVPTVVLLLLLIFFVIARLVCQTPIPVERVMVFPMAVVPSVFGVWNMLFVWLRSRRHLPIGFHGAILPFLLVPSGYLLTRSLGVLTLAPEGAIYFQTLTIPYSFFAIAFPCGLIAYYLVWKYLVGFFNQVLGIA